MVWCQTGMNHYLNQLWPNSLMHIPRADSMFAPSQWETALLCNNVSHWLGTSLESALDTCHQVSRREIKHVVENWSVILKLPFLFETLTQPPCCRHWQAIPRSHSSCHLMSIVWWMAWGPRGDGGNLHEDDIPWQPFLYRWPWVWHNGMASWHSKTSALLVLCEGNASVTDAFPSQRASNVEFWVFFVVCWMGCLTNSWVVSECRCHNAHVISL